MRTLILLLAASMASSGCAMTYRDAAGRDHFVGLMHLVVQGTEDAWVTHSRSAGLTLERGPYCSSATLGFASSLRAAPPAADGIYSLEYESGRPFAAKLCRPATDSKSSTTGCAVVLPNWMAKEPVSGMMQPER